METTDHSNADSKLALKAGGLYLIAEFITRGISFMATPVFSRLLPKEVFADARIFESWVYLLAPIISLSLYQSIARAKLDYRERFAGYLSSVLTLLTILAAGTLVCGAIFYPLVRKLLGFEWPLLLLMLIYSLAYNGMQCVQIYERQNMNYRMNVLLTVLAVVPGILISVFCIVAFGRSASNESLLNLRLFSFFLPTTIIGVVVMSIAGKRGGVYLDTSMWKYAVKFSVPMMATAISSQIFFQSAAIVVRRMVGASEAALVSIAMTVGYIMDILVHAVDNAWRPWMYEKMEGEDPQSVRKVWRILLLTVALVVWCLTMLAPEFTLVLGGEKYMEAVPLICPILCGSLANFLVIEYTAVEQYYKITRVSGIVSLIASFIDVALNVLFVKLFGYSAVVYTTAMAYLLICVLHYYMIRKVEKGNVLLNGFSFLIISITFLLCLLTTLCYTWSTLIRIAIVFVALGAVAVAIRKPAMQMIKKMK